MCQQNRLGGRLYHSGGCLSARAVVRFEGEALELARPRPSHVRSFGTACPPRSRRGAWQGDLVSGSGVARSARMAAIVRRFFPWVVVDLPLVWACYALALLVRGVTTDLEYAPALE